MRRLFATVSAFVDSLQGRLTLLLTVGLAASAILSLLVAEQSRKRDFEQARLDRVIASTADIADRLQRDPDHTTQALRNYDILGAQFAPQPVKLELPNRFLTSLLTARLGAHAQPQAAQVPSNLCFPEGLDLSSRAAGADSHFLDCWYVYFVDNKGVSRELAFDFPPLPTPHSSTLDPIYLLGILMASGVLSFLVARFVTKPLRRLTDAARGFSLSADPEPIPVLGPTEVRAALGTFNLMQTRIRDGVRERTHILAAIAHDLQTPLTRLRLRLEQVVEPVLREHLIADLATMQTLVKDGLELARSSENREPWSVVEIDTLLSSLCEDAAEFGSDVRFTGGCGARVRVKPNALARCITNLIDNAVKYGGDAEVYCVLEGTGVEVRIRDHGPGIDEQLLPTIFEPFVRRNTSRSRETGGTGIGLTIARAQAATFGATIAVANHVKGGTLATVRIVLER
ncbi:Signal transduction histidine kinase [Enhydrobacter aerosaccus]|uniref:histidine kinase n=1 Tax=Enhydrobacter aerosaccus TaxID=225324 RepID=A0A1T4TJN5_9HYPH|nr:ATP-binding protein [Enhydrobacter aerosaccus]SKA40657.1 Signal transduction histidine kinase [Enhydrobacter aerosaccus]